MDIKNNQRGFGAVEAILIVIIIGIVGGAGWYVLKSSKNISQKNDRTVTATTAAAAMAFMPTAALPTAAMVTAVPARGCMRLSPASVMEKPARARL